MSRIELSKNIISKDESISASTSSSLQQFPLLIDHLRMRRIGHDKASKKEVFETILPPLSVSAFTKSNAFGGMLIALVIQAGFHTLSKDDDWLLFSISGNFLGPSSTLSPLKIEIENVRSTKNYQTRIAKLFNSENQIRFLAILDFCHQSKHVTHPITGDELRFNEKNMKTFESLRIGPKGFLDWKEMALQKKENGKVNESEYNLFNNLYDQRSKLVNMRFEPKSLISESLSAFTPISKDREEIKKAKWYREPNTLIEHIWKKPCIPLLPFIDSTSSSDEKGEILSSSPTSITFAQLAFNLDPRVVGTMCVINQIPFGIGQISVTLDISIRFHTFNINVDDWHLYETQIKDEGYARFFGETRCYDQKGEKIATASQQAALRIIDPKAKSSSQKSQKRETKL